ncbi:zinc transporter ZIP10-like isoform X2 [Lytechinus variegatus]|uniref:zinc transporter ZIP10-like isoform X2 n=1 Tax=Lytechinus variegatus TaxID=7654 RepID=UPI001BB2563B|nr:zinc transporter ZIP10-like isoform X2 [Lytechinus variegatus]
MAFLTWSKPGNPFFIQLYMDYICLFMLCCSHLWYAEAQSGQGLHAASELKEALCNDPNGTSFNAWTGDCMSDLFMKYGKDGKLEYDGFRQLLDNVGLGVVRDSLMHPKTHEKNTSHTHHSEETDHLHDHTPNRRKREEVNSTASSNTKGIHNTQHLDHHQTEFEHATKCLSADEILNTLSLIPSEGIVPLQFLQLCPILLQQLDSHACIVYDIHGPGDEHNHSDEHSTPPPEEPSKTHLGQLWGYSIGAVTMISVASVTCIMMVPCIQRFPLAYGRLLSFLVAMAVGTLSGDSVLHLLPHSFGIHAHDEIHVDVEVPTEVASDSHFHPTSAPSAEADKHVVVWRGCVVLLGIFSFFIFEQMMRMCKKRPKKRLESKPSLSEEGNQNGSGSQDIGERLCNHNDTANELIPMMHQRGTDEAKVVNEHCPGVFSFKHKSAVIPHVELNDKEKADEEKEEKKSQSSLDLSMKKDQESSYGGVSTSICKDTDLFSVSTPKKVVESDGLSSTPGNHEHSYHQHNSDHHHHHFHHHHHGHSHHGHSHANTGKMGISAIAWMVVMGDGVHNFTDGLIVGAAFADSLAGGLSTAIAVMCHEIPHELGDFAVMLRGGMSIKQALAFQAVSSILAYVGMAIGLSIGHLNSVSLWIFALAGGAFLYIALTDLFPEMVESLNNTTDSKSCHLLLQVLGALFGIGTMLVIALYEELLIAALST